MKKLSARTLSIAVISAAAVIAIAFWKPTVLVYSLQRAGLYAAIALPMALILGIVHIVNLAHGEFMMISAYLTYFISRTLGIDPLLCLVPVTVVMFFVGMLIYRFTVHYALKAPELNQLILTFGIAMILSQTMNLIATSQPRKISLNYVSASLTIGETSFGVYDFVFVGLAIVFLVGLQLFLTRTRLGKAALAVGQNPKGAALVGINVRRTYLLIFSGAISLVGIMGVFFLTKQSIFPTVGGSYTMKSFCLVAMAGIGNLPAIVLASLGLGLAESVMLSIRGLSGWSHIVFFILIIAVILSRSLKRGKE